MEVGVQERLMTCLLYCSFSSHRMDALTLLVCLSCSPPKLFCLRLLISNVRKKLLKVDAGAKSELVLLCLGQINVIISLPGF